MKKTAWDIIGAKFWQLGSPRIKPRSEDINRYLESLTQKDTCCIIGASTFSLIKAALHQDLNVTVVDFSNIMCQELAKELKETTPDMVLTDLTTTVPEILINKFSIILSDRIINRFDKQETISFLNNIQKMLKKNGVFRTIVKMGLYDLDKELLNFQIENSNEPQIFCLKKNTINFAKAHSAFKYIQLENGKIPNQTLKKWYIHRGQEQRFTEKLFEELVNTRSGDSNRFKIINKVCVGSKHSFIMYTIINEPK